MRIVMPEQKKLTYEARLRVAWSDMDAMGHVNNAVYFRYMEMIRTDFMRSVGVSIDPTGEGPVVVNCFCTYLVQLAYPAELSCKHYVANVGDKSFEAWVTLHDDTGRVCSEGGATTVWFDYASQASKALPDWLRAKLV